MKIVVAPDSFKESLTARQVADTIAAACRRHLPDAELVTLPMADGGEGTSQSLVDALGGHWRQLGVSGPLGEPVQARYGLVGDLAIIEMAEASGLHRVAADRRDVLSACSYGTGQLLDDALEQGVRRIIIGLGGSATNDAGAGMLTALGARFLDARGRAIPRGGIGLAELDRIDLTALHPRLAEVDIVVACDVDNPLTGPRGASAVFGPQKGASRAQVATLDRNLAHFAGLAGKATATELDAVPGAGAAGGMGAALIGFAGARLRPGIDIVAEAVGLAQACRDADLVITGEGRIDSQSVAGKTPVGVARIARQAGVGRVIAIAGCLGEGSDLVYQYGIDAVFDCLHQLASQQEVLRDGEQNLRQTADAVARLIARLRDI